jgi:hypothetical protein
LVGTVDGRHYTEWVKDVKALRRAGHENEAEALLLRLIDAVEGALPNAGALPRGTKNRWPSSAPSVAMLPER